MDSYVFFAAWTAFTVCFVNLDFFLVVPSTIFAVGKRCREGRVSFFVILPSNARRWRKVGFSFYLDSSGFCGRLVAVRGWEKADRNRDLGVKVQIAGVEESSLEYLSNREAIRKEDKKDSCFGGLRGKAEVDGLPAPRFYLSKLLKIIIRDACVVMPDEQGGEQLMKLDKLEVKKRCGWVWLGSLGRFLATRL